MTEAAGGDGRAEMEGRIIQRSLEEETFRRRLLENPRAAVEEELGSRLPEGVQVMAVEETADTIYLVLPSAGRCRWRTLGPGSRGSSRRSRHLLGCHLP
jgi:hypothetical protein